MSDSRNMWRGAQRGGVTCPSHIALPTLTLRGRQKTDILACHAPSVHLPKGPSLVCYVVGSLPPNPILPQLSLNLALSYFSINLDVPICEKGSLAGWGYNQEGQLFLSGAERMSESGGAEWRHLVCLWGLGLFARVLPSKTICSWL